MNQPIIAVSCSSDKKDGIELRPAGAHERWIELALDVEPEVAFIALDIFDSSTAQNPWNPDRLQGLRRVG